MNTFSKTPLNLCGIVTNPRLLLSNARSSLCSVLLYSKKIFIHACNFQDQFFTCHSFILPNKRGQCCSCQDYNRNLSNEEIQLSVLSVPEQFHTDSTGFQTLLKEKEKLSNNYGQSCPTRYCFITQLKRTRITVEKTVWSTPELFPGSSAATAQHRREHLSGIF